MENCLLVFDGHALLYRAYHAFPDLTAPDGRLVNAVYGFTRIMLTVLRRYDPQYLAVAFDHPTKTFRHDKFAEYKANRVEMPDELKTQSQLVREMVKNLNIPQFELAGYEADDLIGTLAAQVQQQGQLSVVIVTGDKDLLQLVNDSVHVFIPKRGQKGEDIEYDRPQVQKKMGVTPDRVVELKALMGDASDNVPGVRGIGQKTAQKLIAEFGNLERLYQAVGEESAGQQQPLLKGSVLEKLKAGRDSAFASRELVKIDTHAPIKLELADCLVSGYDKEQAVKLFEELGFRSLVKLLPADDFEVGVQGALF